VRAAREARPELPLEAECRDEAEVREALEAGAERLLLDNMDAAELRAAVGLRDSLVPEAKLEVSGGVTLENVRAIAETGVDFISVGALTHSAPALDLSMYLDAG
jgi:nicotinate-nucleotide pyrophosphorylase (carboxylating)